MNYIKIDDGQLINLDLIEEVQHEGQSTWLYPPGSAVTSEGYYVFYDPKGELFNRIKEKVL